MSEPEALSHEPTTSKRQTFKHPESTTTEPLAAVDELREESSWARSLVGLVWNSVEGDAKNRRYVQKLDTFLL